MPRRRRSAAGFDAFSEFADSPVPRSMGELVTHRNDKRNWPLDDFKTAPSM
jgi:hypothetical protein